MYGIMIFCRIKRDKMSKNLKKTEKKISMAPYGIGILDPVLLNGSGSGLFEQDPNPDPTI